MNMRLTSPILVLLGCVAAAFSQTASQESFAVARLENGATVGFAMMRTGAASPGEAIGEVVFPRSNTVSRVLYDQASGAYFGYRLEVDSVQTNRYRIVFTPLPDSVASGLQRHMRCPTCPRPALLAGSMPRFPEPMTVLEGAVCTVDLLVNPRTGEKIIDVLMVSLNAVTRENMKEATAKIREGFRLTLAGDSLAARGNLKGAIAEYERAAANNPNDAVVRNRLGIIYQRNGDIDKAQKQFELAVNLNPRFAEAWNNIGSCYHAHGKFKQAIRYYRKAIESKPGLATTHRNIASAYFAQRRFEDGYEALQAAFRLDPSILESPDPFGIKAFDANAAAQYFFFAKVTAANGQLDTALDFLRKAAASGFKEWDSIARDPDFGKLKADPRYQELLRSTLTRQ